MSNDSPTRLLAALQRTAAALRELRVPFALIGGLAVSARAEPRFTRDIDLAVAIRDDSAAEALVSGLIARGFRLQLALEQAALGRLATVRLTPPEEPAEGIVVDLLFASSGIEADICGAAEEIEIAAGLSIPIATASHLLVTKVLARQADRPQDEGDIQALLRVLDGDGRASAVAAAERVEEVGANRGKRLREEVQALVAPG